MTKIFLFSEEIDHIWFFLWVRSDHQCIWRDPTWYVWQCDRPHVHYSGGEGTNYLFDDSIKNTGEAWRALQAFDQSICLLIISSSNNRARGVEGRETNQTFPPSLRAEANKGLTMSRVQNVLYSHYFADLDLSDPSYVCYNWNCVEWGLVSPDLSISISPTLTPWPVGRLQCHTVAKYLCWNNSRIEKRYRDLAANSGITVVKYYKEYEMPSKLS